MNSRDRYISNKYKDYQTIMRREERGGTVEYYNKWNAKQILPVNLDERKLFNAQDYYYLRQINKGLK